MMTKLRIDDWVDQERLKNYPRIFLIINIVALLAWGFNIDGLMDFRGKPFGTDFVSFYAAAKFALNGEAWLAYDFAAHHKMERAVIGTEEIGYFSFFYPPIFFLIIAPLAKLPYLWALFVWQATSFTFFVAMVKLLSKRREAILLSLAFPGLVIVVGHGQGAFLTAGLLIGSLHFLDRKPVLAGIMIGLLTFKPHFGLLIPIVLMLSGRWKVFFSASVTTVSLALLSLFFFGEKSWLTFIENAPKVREVMTDGIVPFYKMQSLFSALRELGISTSIAMTVHILLATGISFFVFWLWRQRIDKRLQFAAFGISCLLVTPFVLDYDLTILAIPIICLASYGLEKTFRPGLVSLLCFAWVFPLFARTLAMWVVIPWTPILLLFLMYYVYKAACDELQNLDANHQQQD